jgi:PhnB protein
MVSSPTGQLKSAVFITFSGNCKKALTFYQSCFGGTLQLEPFEAILEGYPETPIVSGSLLADRITILGSDLVHTEGRKPGNYMSIFLLCTNTNERKELIKKLAIDHGESLVKNREAHKLVEVTDGFEVRWVLGV